MPDNKTEDFGALVDAIGPQSHKNKKDRENGTIPCPPLVDKAGLIAREAKEAVRKQEAAAREAVAEARESRRQAELDADEARKFDKSLGELKSHFRSGS
jgi:hypothetical protein